MRHKPILGMLISMACGAQILLYCWSMFDIGVAVIAGDLIVSYMVLMHETEVVVSFYPFLDIMA